MSDKMRFRKISAAVGILLVLLAGFMFVIFHTPKLVISEVCAVNDGKHKEAALRDSRGKLCDWVELYNPNKHSVSLAGYSLCREGGAECAISGGSIPAGGYAVVYCTKNGFESRNVPSAELDIPKAEGCTVTLKCGSLVIDSISTEPTAKGMTLCAGEDGTYISAPTPCAANAEACYASQVVFSKESGFYRQGFALEMTSDNSAGIYYTFDGTDPRTSDTAEIYSSAVSIRDRSKDKNVLSAVDPMKIQLEYRTGKVEAPKDGDVDKATVVRACARSSDGKWGLVSTATYFVGLSTADHSGMPVISLVTEPSSLYDNETGIYVRGKVYEDFYPTDPDHLYNGSIPANYNQKGREWERECTLQFFESDGSLQFTQDAGMRIQGGWSRADYQKSFRFYARSEYGKDSFDYCFWQGAETADGQVNDSFSTFVLRNGGNDSNFLKYKDILMQDMAGGLLPATQTGRPCVLFIDGEYWGFYTLQEDQSQEYFAKHYGVSEDSVAIYRNAVLDEGLAVDDLSYRTMRDFIIGNDMSDGENYRRVCEMMDTDNFIDYCAAEIYIFNDDWPQNNYGCWRSSDGSTYGDGKWRFFFFDTESCAFHYDTKNADVDYYSYLKSKSYRPMAKMILSLLENEDFSERLNTRLMDMGSLVFTEDRLKTFEKKYCDSYLSEMPAYFLRFPTHRTVDGSSKPMRERMYLFFVQRRGQLINDISGHYHIGKPKTVKIVSDGVMLNGFETDAKFSGKYFRGSRLTFSTAEEGVSWKVTRDGKSKVFEGDTLELTVDLNTEVELIHD